MPADIIDIHLHFGAPSGPNGAADGCFWSKKFEKSITFLAMRLVTGSLFGPVTFERVKRKLLKVVNGSEAVNSGVLLALDKVFDESGRGRDEATHLYISNRVVAEIARENPRVLFGCSVHPFNPAWGEELDFCLDNGAVLCKWLPSAQLINPTHSACIPFFNKLAKHKLPLLYHTGPELSVPTSDESYEEFNNAKYMRRALDMGVTVIFAHCSLPFAPGSISHSRSYQDLLNVMYEATNGGWKAYADLSALFILREVYISRVLEDLPLERLVLGSDYPIPMIGWPVKKKLGAWDWIKRVFDALRQNPLDRNLKLLRDRGFPETAFTRAAELFARIAR